MNFERLYDHTEKMLNDDKLSVQEKCSLLSEWKQKTEAAIEKTTLYGTEIYQACEFLAYLSLKRYNLVNAEETP